MTSFYNTDTHALLAKLQEVHGLMSLKASLALYASAIFVGFLYYRAFLGPLAHLPGPFLARFTGQWRNVRYWRGKWHEDILKIHRTYGPIVRIAPNEVSWLIEEL